jgi:protein-S-isoprenylcysteine O-methyltransferase Ste14
MVRSFGFRRLLHDLRHRRERFRQFVGITFVALVSLLGEPKGMVLFSVGAFFVFLGTATRLWSSGHIMKNKALATTGPYGYVRHPLYVGNITLGFGFALASGLWWSFLLFFAILMVFYPPAIQREDEKLHRRFKQEWEQWRERTRALIPRLTPYNPAEPGGWSLWQSLRRNGEPLIALFLLFWLYVLYLQLS